MAITTEGTYQDFAYTGGIQTFTVPYDGLYKLECYGSKGANATNYSGGNGGYAYGFKQLKKGTIVYVVCGNNGGTSGGNGATSGTGYNGGGYGRSQSDYSNSRAGSGGGATHIATVSGLLTSIGKTNFDSYGLLVAGGGGGAYQDDPSGGGGGGAGGTVRTSGTFGQGTSASEMHGGGGGGYYGGTLGGYYSGSGGGSSWVGGVPSITYKGVTYSPSTTAGVNSGNGKARITFVKKGFPTIIYNGVTLEGINFNGTEVDTVVFNGVTLE